MSTTRIGNEGSNEITFIFNAGSFMIVTIVTISRLVMMMMMKIIIII